MSTEGSQVTEGGQVEAKSAELAATIGELVAAQPAPPEPDSAQAKRATKLEMRDRALMVATMIISGARKSDIKKSLRNKWGLSPRTAERYIRLARNGMAQDASATKQELIDESLLFYRSVTASKTSSYRDKIAARKAIDELMGLQAPRKIAPVTPEGEPLPIRPALETLTDDQLQALVEARQKMMTITVESKPVGSQSAPVIQPGTAVDG